MSLFQLGQPASSELSTLAEEVNTAPLFAGGNDVLTLTVPAYDAGSERNDELCASIPGPNFVECGGSGGRGAT